MLLREKKCISLSGLAGRLVLLVVNQSFGAHLVRAY